MDAPRLIDKGDGSVLTVAWNDDRIDRLPAGFLRAACPCAACQGNAEPLPGVRVEAVAPVGSYAVAMTFGPDGHGSGIFPFELLRGLGGGLS
ncbi:MAG: DUF971 domain-containing protein [Acidimicrobiia bacterium]|nr:DUF971 domain-containing protein [Acidimicrobiia bacterium]